MSALVSRRALMAGTPALPIVAAAAPAAGAEPHPDAEILALVAMVLANRAEGDALALPYLDVLGGPPPEVWVRIKELVAEYHKLIEELWPLPARTLVGVVAKARVLAAQILLAADGVTPAEREGWMQWSLCRDLLALPGGAA